MLVKNLTVERLSQAIEEADQQPRRRRAQAIGQQISREDGTGEAVKWIEEYSNNFHK
jgi:UDP:flavonoid glycosyltransferase YjiC (YdhE family)